MIAASCGRFEFALARTDLYDDRRFQCLRSRRTFRERDGLLPWTLVKGVDGRALDKLTGTMEANILFTSMTFEPVACGNFREDKSSFSALFRASQTTERSTSRLSSRIASRSHYRVRNAEG